MVEPWLQKIFDRIAEMRLSRAEVLRRAGLANSTFSDWAKGSTPSFENLEKVLTVINWTQSNLVEGATGSVINLGPLNEITGGEMWAPAQKKAKTFPLSILNEDLVSFEVVTDEYRTAGYHLGDILSGPRSVGGHLDNLIGRDCIIETSKGDKYFKVLRRGSRPGLFTLGSFDRTKEPAPKETDVKIKWAAPVQLIVRN
jgi:transcriptional regulator with XRE-family HTH domain